MQPETILSDEGLNVLDSLSQEKHLQFVKCFYKRIQSHIMGSSEHRENIRGATEPRRLMPTAYLSSQIPSSSVPTSSQQQNNFRPSNCGLAINLSPQWEEQELPIELNVRFSIFLPKLDLTHVTQRSLRTLWQRQDVSAHIRCTIQALVEPKSKVLSTLNQSISDQLFVILNKYNQDPQAWLNGLDRSIDDLSPQEVEYAKSDPIKLMLQLRQRILAKHTKRTRSEDLEKHEELGQVASVDYLVKIEVQKREISGQTRLRLFLRNKTNAVGSFNDPRDGGIFGAYLEILIPKALWTPIELSRFQISYQVDSSIPAQGINCTAGAEPSLDPVPIWTEFLPIHWQKRLYAPNFQAPFEQLSQSTQDIDLQVWKQFSRIWKFIEIIGKP